MKQYTPKLQRDVFLGDPGYSGTEYDYNFPTPLRKELKQKKNLPKRELRINWFESFGFAYWKDTYAPVWHPVVKKTHNIVFLFVRIQVVYR